MRIIFSNLPAIRLAGYTSESLRVAIISSIYSPTFVWFALLCFK